MKLFIVFLLSIASIAYGQYKPGFGPGGKTYTPIEENGVITSIPKTPTTLEAAKAQAFKYQGIILSSVSMKSRSFGGMYTGAKEFPKFMDCKRYMDAFDDKNNYDPQTGRRNLKSTRDMYLKKKISWMGDLKSFLEGKKQPTNTHAMIDDKNYYGNYFSDEELKNDPNLDNTFRFILKNIQYRNSPSAKEDFLRTMSWACRDEVIYNVNSMVLSRARAQEQALNPKIQKRKTDIGCTNFFGKVQKQLWVKPNGLVKSDSQFWEVYEGKVDSKLKILEVNFLRNYINYSLGGLKGTDEYHKYFDHTINIRKMADVLYCANKIKKDDPLIKKIDGYLDRSLKDHPVRSCQLDAIAKVDEEFIKKKKRVALLYDYLPSTAQVKFTNWYNANKEIQAADAKNILGKIGKDFIDQAVKNLVVVGYMYNFEVNEREDLDFKCETFFKGETSNYCKNFQRYARWRIYKEKEKTIKKLKAQGKQPILNCGGKGVLSGVMANFTEKDIEKHMDVKLPKNQSAGMSSIPSRLQEPFMVGLYDRINEVSMDPKYQAIVPLLYSPAFTEQFTLAKDDVYVPQGSYGGGGAMGAGAMPRFKSVAIQSEPVSCNVLTDSLKKSLIDNVIFISNPESFFKIGGWEVGKDFNKGIAKSTAVTQNYIKGYWREIKDDPIKSVLTLISPALTPSKIAMEAKVMSSAKGEVDKMFNPLPSLNEHPEGYVRHLMLLLKHQKKDQFGKDVKTKYLNEFKGHGKLVCTLYHKIDYDKYILKPYIKQNMKLFYGVAKTVAILVTVASWVIPPAGAFVTTALAAGLSTTLTLASIDDLEGKLRSATQDYSLAIQGCVEEQLEIHKTTNAEDYQNYCKSSVGYQIEAYKLSKELSGKYGTLIFETAMYSLYMVRIGVGLVSSAHHGQKAAAATSNLGKLKEFYKTAPHKLGHYLTDKVGKPLAGIVKAGASKVSGTKMAKFFSKMAHKFHHTKIGHSLTHGVQHGVEHMGHDGVYAVVKTGKSAYYSSMFSKMGYLAYFGGDPYRAALLAMLIEKDSYEFKSNNKLGEDSELSEEKVNKIKKKHEEFIATLSDEEVLSKLRLNVEII